MLSTLAVCNKGRRVEFLYKAWPWRRYCHNALWTSNWCLRWNWGMQGSSDFLLTLRIFSYTHTPISYA